MSLLARNIARKKVRTSGPNWRYLSDAFVSYTAGGDITVTDEAYGAGWNGSLEVPTKNALYNKIEALPLPTDGDKGDVVLSSSGTVWTVESLADGTNALSRAGTALTLTNTTDSATVAGLVLHGDRATPANNDALTVEFRLSDSAGNQDLFGRIMAIANDVTDTSEDGNMTFGLMKAGTHTTLLILSGAASALAPNTSDGLALGTTSLMWSDAFFASGAVLNFNNGDVTITHASNSLSGAGGLLYWNYNGGATPTLWLVNSADGAALCALRLDSDRATPAANDSVYLSYFLSDSAGNQDELGRITVQATTVTSTSEVSQMLFSVATGGTLAAELFLTSTTFGPVTSDGNALGSTLNMWADLYLASGGVINFNNGDVTLTHSTNALSGDGGQLYWQYNGAATTAPIRSVNTNDSATNIGFRIDSDRATPTANDSVALSFHLSDSAGNQDEFVQIRVNGTDITNGSEDAELYFRLAVAGTLTSKFVMASTTLGPVADDGAALGGLTLGWSDLHLSSGGTINFNNSNVVLTHSSGVLNVSTGALQQGGVAVNVAGKQSIPIPAAAMTSRTTNGAAAGSTETTTNKIMLITLDYDASTAEYGQFVIPAMPKSWNESTITARFIWTATNTGNVIWGIQAVALTDDDAADTAFGTAQTVTDGVTAANDIMKSAETSAVTIGGTPAEGDMVVFQVYRDAANGSDTCTVDAKLIGVELFVTTNAANDA